MQMNDDTQLTEIFEASLEDVVSAANFDGNDVAVDRVTTALGAVAWNEIPADRVTTALAAVSW
jgi:translation elongation factor EF-Tu-like GTPase